MSLSSNPFIPFRNLWGYSNRVELLGISVPPLFGRWYSVDPGEYVEEVGLRNIEHTFKCEYSSLFVECLRAVVLLCRQPSAFESTRTILLLFRFSIE